MKEIQCKFWLDFKKEYNIVENYNVEFGEIFKQKKYVVKNYSMKISRIKF